MRYIIIYLIFFAQASGSFISDIENVMSSLQNGFQKLISDVVTDVKETIDCTVVAVESALSIGVNNATYRRCTGVDNPKASEHSCDKQTFKYDYEKHENTDSDILKQIISSNRDLISQNENALNGLQGYLKDELEKISTSISNEVKQINEDEKTTVDSVVQYIDYIHNIERTSDNSSEVEHIQNVLKGASKFIKDNYRYQDRNDQKMESILKSLGVKSKNDQTNGKDKFSVTKFEDKISTDIAEHSKFQNSLKDVSDKGLQTGPKSSTEANIFMTNRNSDENIRSLNSIFGGNSQTGDSYKQALEQAKEFLKDSERTNSIVNNLFAKAEKAGKNIFDLS